MIDCSEWKTEKRNKCTNKEEVRMSRITVHHVTSFPDLGIFKPLDFWWTETWRVSIYSKPDENFEHIYEYEFIFLIHVSWYEAPTFPEWISLHSSSSSGDNTFLLINVVHFNVASLEIHTGSTAISRPSEALREVQWLKLGTTFKPVFRPNRASGRAKSWCSPDR